MTQDPRVEQIQRTVASAKIVLTHVFGDKLSVIDPSRRIWTEHAARAFLAHLSAPESDASGAPIERISRLLRGADREVVLFAAESVFIRNIAMHGIRPETKVGHMQEILNVLPDTPSVPAELAHSFADAGVAQAGRGFNSALARQLRWIAEMVVRFDDLADFNAQRYIKHPWPFRDFVESISSDDTYMPNILMFLMHPDTFEPLFNANDKQKIVKALIDSLPLQEEDDSLDTADVDLMLRELRKAHQKEGVEYINWYDKPWIDKWAPSKPKVMRAWLVRPESETALQDIAQWVAEGFVSLRGGHLPRIEGNESKKDLKAIFAESYGHLTNSQAEAMVTYYHQMLSSMSVDDFVVTRRGSEVRIGRIISDANYYDDVPRVRRSVDWDPQTFEFAALPSPLPKELDRSGQVAEISDAIEPLRNLFTVATDDEDPEQQPEPEAPKPFIGNLRLPRATTELESKLHTTKDWLNEFIEVLEDRKQVILYGPPGTGKTYLAKTVARHLNTDGAAVQIVQFHPSYSYEDFFEGFRPTNTGDGGMTVALQDGPLKRIAASAKANPSQPHVLIIDEINRANLAKVFGELYFLLEYREELIQLQYSPGQEFDLPRNLYIVGTMNTADRSIAMVDAAIRRRFAFMEMHPQVEPVASLLTNWLSANSKPLDRAHLLRELNLQLGDTHRDFQIGPSYLMRAAAETDAGLERVWKYDILPLLEEHFYGHLNSQQIAERFGLATLKRRVEKTIGDDTTEIAGNDYQPVAPQFAASQSSSLDDADPAQPLTNGEASL